MESMLLAQMNLFVRRGFFDAELCEQVKAEMQRLRRGKARLQVGADSAVLEESRQTKTVEPSGATMELVTRRFEEVMPELAVGFGVDLGRFESPRFLVYEEGDFFLPHRDTHDEDVPDRISARKVSASVVINDQGTAASDTYAGGALVFSGLVPGLDDGGRGFSMALSAGTLVAFLSTTVHEVKRVERGERYSVVTWFS